MLAAQYHSKNVIKCYKKCFCVFSFFFCFVKFVHSFIPLPFLPIVRDIFLQSFHFACLAFVTLVVGQRRNIPYTTNIQYSRRNGREKKIRDVLDEEMRGNVLNDCSPLGWPWSQGISVAFFFCSILWNENQRTKWWKHVSDNRSTGCRSAWIRFILHLSGCAHFKPTKIVHVLSELIAAMC